MTGLALFLIARVTPSTDREAVVGDTLEQLDAVTRTHGAAAARRWVWREALRVLAGAPRHHFAARWSPRPAATFRMDGSMSSIWQDVRFALRCLGRSRGFAAVAVLTLALGIGANTAMFAVVNAVLLRPLPFEHADRLMLVHLVAPGRPGEPAAPGEVVWSYPKYRTFVELQQTFDDSGLFTDAAETLAGEGAPERVQGEVITERYLSTLGISPLVGRPFTFDEANRAGAPPVVLLGHGLWTRRYAANPELLGRTIELGGVTQTVVGILPRGFLGLSGNAEWWRPLAVADAWALNEAQGHNYRLVAKRRAEVTEDEAAAAVRAYGPAIDAAHNEGNGRPWGASAVSLDRSRVDPDVRRVAIVVLGAVGFVLLIACANLTNLLAAKASTREREVAIRLAIGASRGRIVRQFAVEGLTLAALGAAGGVVVASLLLSIATVILPDADIFFRGAGGPGGSRIAGADGLTRVSAAAIGLDTVTLLFTATVGILTALLVSILPAAQASGLRPGLSLKRAGAAAGRRNGRFGPRGFLVAAEIAMALVLMTGAGLMLKSAWHLRTTPLGIDASDVVTAGLSLPPASYPPERGRALYADLMTRLGALPGIQAVGVGSCTPAGGPCNATSIKFPNRPPVKGTPPVGVRWVSPGFFDALRIPLLQGRMFTDLDRAGQPKVVVVNATAAKTYWPGENPVGQRVSIGQGGFEDGAEVIGVVADVRYRNIESTATPDIYLPVAQSYRAGLRLFLRSQLGTAAVVSAITTNVRALDPNLPLIGVKTMDASVGDAMWRTRVAAWLLSAFAGLAMLLTGIGVFGVMAQLVVQRTAEFGVRMALGARPQDVLALVLRRAVLVTAVGLALGLAGSLAATRSIGTLLYGVTPTDPATVVAVAATLAAISIAACYLPARRATRVNAIVALRSE